MIARTLAATALAMLALAGPAAAHGIGGIVADVPTGTHITHGPMASAAALDYGGGPVLHSNRTHVIFWTPSGSPDLTFEPGYETLVERFLADVAVDSHHASNVYGLTGQYTDASGPAVYASTYAGAVIATDPLPPPPNQCVEPATGPPGWTVCLTDAQLQTELDAVVRADGLPRTGNDIYFLVLPDGLGTCTDASSSSCALGGSATGYCGYHSQTDSGLLYAVIPYNDVEHHCQSDNPKPNGNPADPALSTISHEHSETITDPQTYTAWIDPNGQEDGDLCITTFGSTLGQTSAGAYNETIAGGHFYLQEEWSNEDGGCRGRDETDSASFAAPGRLTAGRAFRLTGRAADPDGRIVAWAWHFGDGSPGSHKRVTAHIYRHPGTYRLLLRVADSAGNWTAFTRTVHVSARVRAPAHR